VISCWLGLPVNLFLLFLSSLSSSQTIFLYDIHGLYFNSFLSSLFNFFFLIYSVFRSLGLWYLVGLPGFVFVWFLMLNSEARGHYVFFVFFNLCKFECSGGKGCVG